MSLPIDEIVALARDFVPPDQITAFAKTLVKAESANKAAREPAKRTKTRLTVVLRGDSALQQAVAGGAWVIVQPDPQEDNAPKTPVVERLTRAVAVFNDTRRKGQPIKTWAEAFRWLKPKALKAAESGIAIKAREPVEVVVLEKETVAP